MRAVPLGILLLSCAPQTICWLCFLLCCIASTLGSTEEDDEERVARSNVLFQRANALAAREKTAEEALSLYRSAIGLFPLHVSAWSNLFVSVCLRLCLLWTIKHMYTAAIGER